MRAKVYQCEGRVIRDPKHGRVIPAEGTEVVLTAYWNRLRRDGDVFFEGDEVLSTPPASDASDN